MMDVYRLLDPAVVAFDFAVLHEGEHFFDEEIRKGGSEKYVLPTISTLFLLASCWRQTM